ncbi:hypothetical protein LCGC14_1189130 [marine sediment metagenome]|uniref:Uncharacterized protein n=1 Tax=marine sediment metagenome TaxID=412755 RepID=A0A0F9P2P0_9ZZZZ
MPGPFVKIDPAAEGVNCALCYGIGKPFGNIVTPERITVVFTGIQRGPGWLPGDPEPPNGSYRLNQVAPCTFQFVGANWITAISWTVDRTTVELLNPLFTAFSSQPTLNCQTFVPNELSGPAVDFINGTATISPEG